MNTVRLLVTPKIRSDLDWLRETLYPLLSDAEILKVVIGCEYLRVKRKHELEKSLEKIGK